MYNFLHWPREAVAVACTVAAFGPALVMTWAIGFTRLHAWTLPWAGAEPAVIGMVSLLFGLFGAFLSNDIWTRNQAAHQAVIDEADAIRTLARLSEGMASDSDAMRTALADYAKAVIDKDWPMMQHGQRSLEILSKVRAISNLIISGPISKAVSPAVQGKLLDSYSQLREKRQQRVQLAESRTFTIKWHAWFAFALLTQVAITITHLTKPRAMLLAQLVFAAALSVCLSILIVNEFPFSAMNPISSAPLESAVKSLYRQ